MMPLWLGRQKDSEQVFPAGLCVALTPHHQGFTSPIYLILFSPPTHAPLFMHYVKKKKKIETAFSCLSSLSISHPLPAPFQSFAPSPPSPSLPFIFFSLSPLSLFLLWPFTLLSPILPTLNWCVYACVCVCEFVWDQSFFRRLTASTDSEGTASSQDMKNASHKFVIRPWVIMAKAPITSD